MRSQELRAPRCLQAIVPLVTAITAALTSASAMAAPPPKPAGGQPTKIDLDESAASDPAWRQTLMAPRITGNLRAITVDPSDPKKIYIGTEEGTIVSSDDGGVTWDEVELSPFTLQSPVVRAEATGLPGGSIDVFAGWRGACGAQDCPFNPTGRNTVGEIGALVAGLPLAIYIHNHTTYVGPQRLLGVIANEKPRPYEEIRHVTVCPGGPFTIFATTATKLWGSPDGVSYVPLFIAKESAPLEKVACSPSNPKEVVITSGDGTLRSSDGGASFDPIGQAASSALTFGGVAEGGTPVLYLGTGRELWIGDAGQADAMRVVSLEGEGDIRSVAVTGRAVWVATDSGVRASHDGGATFAQIDDLEGRPWRSIAVTPGAEAGREHVVVMGDDIAFASFDGGKLFRPYFRAESRRRLRQIVATAASDRTAERFMLLTSGEVFSTTAPEPSGEAASLEIRRWAEQRLRRMPSLQEVLDRALSSAQLTDLQLDELYDNIKIRAWLPVVDFNAFFAAHRIAEARSTTLGTTPTVVVLQDGFDVYGGTVNFRWALPDIVGPQYAFAPVRKDLYEVRKVLEFVVEDAYDERKQILVQIAGGGLDAEQLLTLQARLEVLEVVLDELTKSQRR